MPTGRQRSRTGLVREFQLPPQTAFFKVRHALHPDPAAGPARSRGAGRFRVVERGVLELHVAGLLALGLGHRHAGAHIRGARGFGAEYDLEQEGPYVPQSLRLSLAWWRAPASQRSDTISTWRPATWLLLYAILWH